MENPELTEQETNSNSDVYQLITVEQIQTYTELLKNRGVDISQTKIHLTNPGEDLFDQCEIQHKLLYEKCHSNWENYIQLIRLNHLDENALSIQDLRRLATQEGIKLDGKLPGFTVTAGDDEIIYFGIKKENIVTMAQNYAQKHGDLNVTITTHQEALEYLQGLAKESIFHEAGHIAFSRLSKKSLDIWNEYLQDHPEIIQKTKDLQKDKYENETEIPVAAESFADGIAQYANEGIGRLNLDSEGINKIQQILQQ